MPENIDGGHHTDITYRDREIPLPTCSKCGKIPWEEVIMHEESKVIDWYTIKPVLEEDGTVIVELDEGEEMDRDACDNWYSHHKIIHDPDPQTDFCKGEITLPEKL